MGLRLWAVGVTTVEGKPSSLTLEARKRNQTLQVSNAVMMGLYSISQYDK